MVLYGTYNELVTGANLNQQTSLGGLTLQQIQLDPIKSH